MDRTWCATLLYIAITIACALFTAQASAQSLSTPQALPEVLDILPGETKTGVFDRLILLSHSEEACPGDGSGKLDMPWVASDTWACLRIRNTGQTPDIWRLDFGGTLGEGYTFWLFQGDRKSQILSAPFARTLAQLETAGPWLASLPFTLLPDETVEIRVLLNAGAWFGDVLSSGLPKLVPEQAYDRALDKRLFLLGAQLAACVLLIGFFLSFSALLRSTPARRYALYFIAATVTLIAYYGLFSYLFPSHPVQRVLAANRFIEIVMIVLHMRFIVSFVRDSIGSHRLLRLSPWLIWAVPLSFGAIFVLQGVSTYLYDHAAPGGVIAAFGDWLWDNGVFIYPVTVIVAWSTLSIWSAAILLHRNTDGAWFFAAGTVLLLVAPCVQFFLAFNSVVDIFTVIYFASALGLVDAIIFAAAIVRLTFGLRAQRDHALQKALTASQEKLHLSQSLLFARENLDTARELAEQHRTRLALTGHDLRQPLLSLRLALDKENAVSPTLRESLSTSLSYLKTVLDQILADTRPQETVAAPTTHIAPQSEPIPLQIIMQNAVRMFQGEASAKHLSLDMVHSSAVAATEPVALIRVVSNLVSNAVKYTDNGRVLIGVRRHAGMVAIEVHDTGPGLTKAQILAIQQSYHRGEASRGTEGEGIGLAGVQLLAAQNNLSLTIRSRPGAGSCFAIEGLQLMDSQPSTLTPKP